MHPQGDAHAAHTTALRLMLLLPPLLQAVRRIVHLGFNVVHSDVDVVWFRDPGHYLSKQVRPCRG